MNAHHGNAPAAQLIELANELSRFRYDPYGFVLFAFPWGVPGSALAFENGPEPWQRDLLQRAGKDLTPDTVLQFARASGHGIGKSALVSFLILWAMSTAADTRGYVTANTDTQLRTKTWAELTKWYHLCVARVLFRLEATSLYSVQPSHERTWRFDATPWSEHNTTAFAGLHNKGKRVLLVFDEASEIADGVWEVAEGALTDAGTERIWCAFGNPTKNTGRFRDCFFKFGATWQHQQIDSRTVSFTDKAQAQKIIDQYGEDDDRTRVRVKGQFPRQAASQFISSELILKCKAYHADPSAVDAMVLGVDVARFGDDLSVIYPRKGRDARTLPIEKYSQLDNMQLAAAVLQAAHRYRADAVFVDEGGTGSGVVDRLRQLNCPGLIAVQFGSKSFGAVIPEFEKYANKRSEIYGALRHAMMGGLMLPDDTELINQLEAIKYGFTNQDEIALQKKELMKIDAGSPDISDALALTYAYPVFAGTYASRVLGGGTASSGRQLVEPDPY